MVDHFPIGKKIGLFLLILICNLVNKNMNSIHKILMKKIMEKMAF